MSNTDFKPGAQGTGAHAASAEAGDAISVLRRLAERMANTKGETSLFGQRLAQALKREDWALAERTLLAYVESAEEVAVTRMAPRAGPVEVVSIEENAWRSAATRLLDAGVPALLPETDPLAAAPRNALQQARRALGQGNTETAASIDALVASCGAYGVSQSRRQALMAEFLSHLLGNVAALTEQESWVQGQLASAELLLKGALAEEALESAIANLKDVAARQAELKAGRDDARETSERMLGRFLSDLDGAAASARQYDSRIASYASRLNGTITSQQLDTLLAELRGDTAAYGETTRRTRAQMAEAQEALLEAKRRISALESKLEEMSELAREDPLTHSMNRRGMMEALCREMGRARRHATPLSIAMIDIDNFKQLNDSLGHRAGDGALVHLVGIIKSTLRQMDVIARFGGEEFLLLLPNTQLDDAVGAVARIQRELTKSIFMYEHQRVLVTFSAGAAVAQAGESENSLIGRADAALYEAKRQGKNRVVAAQ